MERRLASIIEPYDNWFNDSGIEVNNQAKNAIEMFYYELNKINPSKQYIISNQHHLSYFSYIIKIGMAIDEQKYQRVCNELISLIHYEEILQPRVYFNVCHLLEDKLNL